MVTQLNGLTATSLSSMTDGQTQNLTTTQAGSLFCLETGDPGDDGWLMWGAGPNHNGRLE